MFNVAYDTPKGTKLYCLMSMSFDEAVIRAEYFRGRYMERQPDGTWKGKEYPNGKGFYDVSNVRVVEVAASPSG